MNQIPIDYRGKLLTLSTFSNSRNMNLSKPLQCNCHQLFSNCFRETENTNCQETFPFINLSGCGLVVSDQQDQALLLSSFIWNDIHKVVEIYNICKNPDNQDLSAFVFLTSSRFIP